MTFSQVKGYEHICAALKGMVDSSRIPHAIMLHQEDGGAAMEVALAFLQYLYCKNRGEDSCGTCPSCNKIAKLIHPDVHFVFPVNTANCLEYIKEWRELVLSNPRFTENELSEALQIEGKSALIKVEQAKNLIEVLSLSALEKGYRSVLIYLPEKLNISAANSLLKLIEEPPALTQFILITHNPEQVLPTIASRCQTIRLVPQGGRNTTNIELDNLFRALMQALLAKDLYACLEVADELANLSSKEKAKNFCKLGAESLRNIFLLQQGVATLVNVEENKLQEYQSWAKLSKKTFPRKALDAFSLCQQRIGRNVNVRILFTELVNTLYLSI